MDERPNRFYCGDNLDLLRLGYVEAESVDLVYLDPPFQSGRDHNLLFKLEGGRRVRAQEQVFEDTWDWDDTASRTYDDLLRTGTPIATAVEAISRFLGGPCSMLAYVAMMAIRLIELHKVLKPTGALYVHCDPTASHYLKVVLDAIFGPDKFRSEVIWKRSSAHNNSRRFSPVHDTLLFYTKGDRYTWNPIFQPLPQETADAWYNNVEKSTGRRFRRADLTAVGMRSGASGKPWRGVDPTAKGRHWAIPRFIKDVVGDLDTHDALDALDKAGRIHWPTKVGGVPMLKRYLSEAVGIPALDVITHIPPLNNVDAERLGYPTQKPLALMEHLITASSNEGDVVLDPFCGCGTTVHAAHRLKRRWIGIDIASRALDLIRTRLSEEFGPAALDTFDVRWEPRDLESARQLADADRYQFEQWVLAQLGAHDDKVKGADKGIDGVLTFHDGSKLRKIMLSVKSGKATVGHLRDLRGVVDREEAAIGVLVTLQEPTRAMRTEANSAGFYSLTRAGLLSKHRRLQLLTVEMLLDGVGIDAPVPPPKSINRRPQGRQREFSFMGGWNTHAPEDSNDLLEHAWKQAGAKVPRGPKQAEKSPPSRAHRSHGKGKD